MIATAARRQLAALVPTTVDPGRPLLRRGDQAGGAYLVVAGSLRVYYVTADGRDATLYQVRSGGTCILALTATLRSAHYPAWVDAGPTGGAFVRVPTALFHQLLERFDGIKNTPPRLLVEVVLFSLGSPTQSPAHDDRSASSNTRLHAGGSRKAPIAWGAQNLHP